jgi:hypothetical protein
MHNSDFPTRKWLLLLHIPFSRMSLHSWGIISSVWIIQITKIRGLKRGNHRATGIEKTVDATLHLNCRVLGFLSHHKPTRYGLNDGRSVRTGSFSRRAQLHEWLSEAWLHLVPSLRKYQKRPALLFLGRCYAFTREHFSRITIQHSL